MSDESKKDPKLQEELKKLGEIDADSEEIAAARRLAERLEGGLRVVDAAEDAADLDELASLSRAMKVGSGDPLRQGEALTSRILAEAFSDTDEAGDETPAPDAPAPDLEQASANRLAAALDRTIAGCQAPDLTEQPELQDLLRLTTMIRASVHVHTLSKARLDSLLDQAVDAESAAKPRLASRGLRVIAGLALAAALAVGIVGVSLSVREPAAVPEPIPTHLSSRSTRDILPTAFPRSQTATERIDLIYHDRLRGYRELQLGALGAPNPSGRGRP